MPKRQWKSISETICNLCSSKRRKDAKAPYSNQLTQEEIDRILDRAVKQTSRYQSMKAAAETQIKAFIRHLDRTDVSLHGTVKNSIPMDSSVNKHFLRANLSMDPITDR